MKKFIKCLIVLIISLFLMIGPSYADCIYNAKSNLRETERKAMKLLENAGIKERAKHLPAQLSGGERQRVAIVRALINDPLIVFADEPTANLDSKTAHRIIELMHKIKQDYNTTFVFATHDEKIVSSAERLITLVDGQITEDKRIAL